MVVEPLVHGLVLVRVHVHLDRLEGFHVEHVVGVVERRLLVVERREAHALEVASVALLATHHDPHGAAGKRVRHVIMGTRGEGSQQGTENECDQCDCGDTRETHPNFLAQQPAVIVDSTAGAWISPPPARPACGRNT